MVLSTIRRVQIGTTRLVIHDRELYIQYRRIARTMRGHERASTYARRTTLLVFNEDGTHDTGYRSIPAENKPIAIAA